MDWTALGQAIKTANVPAIHHLIDRGANHNIGPATSLSPIFYAVMHAKNESLIALLQRGATPNVVETTQNPLPRAVFPFYVPALSQTLLRHREALIPTCNNSSMLDMFRTLLAAGADPNLASLLGVTPLTLALKLRNLPDRAYFVSALLTRGADPNIPDENQVSPFALCLMAP